jgi:ATP-dependent Lon protease
LAAHQVGLKTVILPKRNEKDWDVVPEDVKKEMNFVLADHVDQVFEAALTDRRGEPGAPKGEGGSSDAHKTEG